MLPVQHYRMLLLTLMLCPFTRISGQFFSDRLFVGVFLVDWDLGVCLHYECKRKQLRKPDILNSWIDLKATYRVRRSTDCETFILILSSQRLTVSEVASQYCTIQ